MTIGHKARNLALLPERWVPPYFVLSSEEIFNNEPQAVAAKIIDRCQSEGFKRIIIRSSAKSETLNQRGQFESYEIDPITSDDIAAVVSKILSQASAANADMALVVQRLLVVDRKGHFSNERRVSATRNQWEIEIEHPTADSIRTNSQRDPLPQTSQQLQLTNTRAIRRVFGSLGSWANANFQSRVHFEWVIEKETLWLVQIDLEDDAPDVGVDPREVLPSASTGSRAAASPPIYHWSEFPDSEFRKIVSIKRFSSQTAGTYPDLYVMHGIDAEACITEGSLEKRLNLIVGERLVCRTDIRPARLDKMDGLNLPRTDTSDPAGVVDFMAKTLYDWRISGLDLKDCIFIIHEYLPAVVGVWADATPDQRIVHVDALWGLPDGLQYLDHDSFEYDLLVDQIVAEHIRHKGWYVAEEDDGNWIRKPVRRDITRFSALPREYVSRIAQATYKLSDERKCRLQVMWFADVKRAGVSDLFPWFAHSPKSTSGELFDQSVHDNSLQRRLPAYSIKTPDDLRSIPDGRFKLKLDLEAQYMRSNQLLEEIADTARRDGHSVEVRGSGLCHAYYLLTNMGVAVVTPNSRRYTRVRGRQTFGKLVRDKIPDRIRSNGERVSYTIVAPHEMRKALSAKLFEEAQEVASSTNVQDILSELADVLEIARAIASTEGLSWNDIESRADTKREQAGSFSKAQLLIETEIPTKDRKEQARKIRSDEPYHVKRQDGGVIVPFLGLIEDGVEFLLNGKAFVMKLRPEGVFLEELSDRETEIQLSLPFLSEH